MEKEVGGDEVFVFGDMNWRLALDRDGEEKVLQMSNQAEGDS